MDIFAILPWVFVAGAAILFMPWGKVRLPSLPSVTTVPTTIPTTVVAESDKGAESRKHFLALMECYLRAGDLTKAAALSAIETGAK